MPNLSRAQAARRFAKRLGISVENAERMIDNNVSQWQTFQAQESITIATPTHARKALAAAHADGIGGSIAALWRSIQSTQAGIDSSLDKGDTKNLTEYARALVALQKAYLEMAEMKRIQDEASGGMVSREQVEQIIQDAFPRLKNAVNDLFLNVKQALPDNVRADYDIAYNKALPNYGKHLAAAVDALNAILDGGDKEQ